MKIRFRFKISLKLSPRPYTLSTRVTWKHEYVRLSIDLHRLYNYKLILYQFWTNFLILFAYFYSKLLTKLGVIAWNIDGYFLDFSDIFYIKKIYFDKNSFINNLHAVRQ